MQAPLGRPGSHLSTTEQEAASGVRPQGWGLIWGETPGSSIWGETRKDVWGQRRMWGIPGPQGPRVLSGPDGHLLWMVLTLHGDCPDRELTRGHQCVSPAASCLPGHPVCPQTVQRWWEV